MRYLRLFSVLLLLSLSLTGCHHRQARVVPAPQTQPPIVTTLPPIPPLTFPDVQLAQPKPEVPVVKQAPPPSPPKKSHPERVRHHRAVHKAEPETSSKTSPPESSPAGSSAEQPTATLGQLSADDASSPNQGGQTRQLIQESEERLKKLSNDQREKHKEDVAQVISFLAQANQAWTTSDFVGAQTLANKAKILLDELLK